MNNIISRGVQPRRSNCEARSMCPVCGTSDTKFHPLSDFYRQESERHGYKYFGRGETIALETYSCAVCGASDRERLYALWIYTQIQSGSLKRSSTLLHFAPEPALSRKLRELGYFEYKSADLSRSDVDITLDIMNMPLSDECFEFFICSHVLEHVESDDKAIRELCRITKRGGSGILMAPICSDIQHTLEDPNITSEAERWQYYGQNDHVRLYGHDDYIKKIEANGFAVEQLGVKEFGEDWFRGLGLTETSVLYIARRV